MLHALIVLARARLQIIRNGFWRSRLSNKFGLVMMSALMSLGAIGAYGFTLAVVRGLRSPRTAALLREAAAQSPGLPSDIAPFLAAVPSFVLLGALGLLIFSSFGSLLSSLYLAGDLDMLLVAPIPMRAVFVVKFFGGLTTQYLILFTFLAPILVGYGQAMGYGLLYMLCAVLALLTMPLLPSGLGALLVMVVVRVVPARRAREIAGLLGGLVGLSFYLITQLGDRLAPAARGADSLAVLLATDLPLLPSAWAARALVAAGEGRFVAMLFYGGLFLGVSAAFFAGCLLLAERLYYAGWSNLAAQGGRVRQKEKGKGHNAAGQHQPFFLLPMTSFLPQESRAILLKDVRLFFRDLRNLQALIFPFAAAGIWTFQLFGNQSTAQGDTPAWAARLGDLSGAGVAFFICLSLSSVLAGTGISREGRAYWLLKLAPISPWRLFLGKLTLAYLPFPLAGTLFLALVAALRNQSPLLFLEQWTLVQLCGLGCAAFGMGLGATFPRLDWEHPAQQSSWQSGCLSSLFFPLYLGIVVSFVVAPAVVADLQGGGPMVIVIRLAGWAVATGLTAALVWLSATLGIRGITRIEV